MFIMLLTRKDISISFWPLVTPNDNGSMHRKASRRHLDLDARLPINTIKVRTTLYFAVGVGHSTHLSNAGYQIRMRMFAKEIHAQTESIINLRTVVVLSACYPIHPPSNHEAYIPPCSAAAAPVVTSIPYTIFGCDSRKTTSLQTRQHRPTYLHLMVTLGGEG